MHYNKVWGECMCMCQAQRTKKGEREEGRAHNVGFPGWVGSARRRRRTKAFQVEGLAYAGTCQQLRSEGGRWQKLWLVFGGARILILSSHIYNSFVSQFTKPFWSFFSIDNCNQTMLEYSFFPGMFIKVCNERGKNLKKTTQISNKCTNYLLLVTGYSF